MAINPRFDKLLQQMSAMHNRKNADYANASNPYSNFEEAAAFAGCSVDTVFAVLVGIKGARLKELVGNNKEPNNESVQDSRLDLAVYAALWASYHLGEVETSSTVATSSISDDIVQAALRYKVDFKP